MKNVFELGHMFFRLFCLGNKGVINRTWGTYVYVFDRFPRRCLISVLHLRSCLTDRYVYKAG